jgi:myo-inositol-1(or 4)-monophosphatase
MLPPLDQLSALVRQAAQEELLPRFHRVARSVKADGSILTEADLAIDRRLKSELAEHWPAVEFLSEEMDSAEQHNLAHDHSRPLWCVDPLDGTSNFAAGLPFYSVSLALLVDGRPQLGVVYDPSRDECFAAERGQGAWLNQHRLGPKPAGIPLRRALALVDFKRLSQDLAQRLVREPPYGSQRNFGSSALEWAWIAAGRGHVYLHGGQKLWDYAAGSLILSEAGGHSMSLDRQPVFQGGMRPRSVICSLDPQLFEAWCAWLGA